MAKETIKPLTQAQIRLLERAKRVPVVKVLSADEPPKYFCGRKNVNPRTFEILLACGALKAIEDGLFGNSQTYVTNPLEV